MLMSMIIICFFMNTWAATPNYYPRYPSEQSYPGKEMTPIVSESNEINPDGTFAYSYATGDGQNVQAQGYLKNAGNKDTESEVIQGSYSYTAPDGTLITVTYVADEFGFRAEGAHLPTPPPIPEAIQRSLQIIAKAQNRQETQSSFPEVRAYSSNHYKSQHQPRPFRY